MCTSSNLALSQTYHHQHCVQPVKSSKGTLLHYLNATVSHLFMASDRVTHTECHDSSTLKCHALAETVHHTTQLGSSATQQQDMSDS